MCAGGGAGAGLPHRIYDIIVPGRAADRNGPDIPIVEGSVSARAAGGDGSTWPAHSGLSSDFSVQPTPGPMTSER